MGCNNIVGFDPLAGSLVLFGAEALRPVSLEDFRYHFQPVNSILKKVS